MRILFTLYHKTSICGVVYVCEFRINLYRKDPITKASSKAVKPHDEALNEALNEILIKKLWLLLWENPKLTQKEISSQLRISRATVQRLTKELLEQGKIERKGGKRHGYWVANEVERLMEIKKQIDSRSFNS